MQLRLSHCLFTPQKALIYYGCMKIRRILSFCVFIFLLTSIVVDAQQTQTTPAGQISISGENIQSISIGLSDLAKLPRVKVHVKDHSGKETEFEGVALCDVLKLAGVKLGSDLR